MNRKTIIKFIIFTGIFYTILTFNVFHLGEKLAPSSKNYLKENIPTEDIDIEEIYFNKITPPKTGHQAAEHRYEIMLSIICKKVDVCNKIFFNGNYTPYEKYIYTKPTTLLIDFIDTHWSGTQTTPLKEVLQKIEINKETWERRGYATWDSIIMNLWAVKTKKEFAELMTHEMGHITDLWYLQWRSSKKDSTYTEFGKIVFEIDDPSLVFYKISRESETIRKAESKKKDFCSGYGMSDPFEDFAECFNLYLNHNIFFREIAKNNPSLKKKYNFIARLVNGQYIATNEKELERIKHNPQRRPRDTTKMTN